MSNTIKKNQTADIPTKNGKNYSYQYVDIAQIHEYLESINAKYIQQIKRIENDDYVMTKRCFNDEWENEWLQGSKVVDATLYGNDNPAQKQGSALTYARRYSLLMAFGLATEDDDATSLNKTEITLDYAKNYVITFGNKHKNETLAQIYEDDAEYLDYLLGNTKDETLAKCIEYLFKNIENETDKKTIENDEDRLKLIVEFTKLVTETNTDKELIYKTYKVKNNTEMTNEQLEQAIRKMKGKKNE